MDNNKLGVVTQFNVTVNEANTAPSINVNTTITKTDTLTDFESVQDGSYNGTVMFRQPILVRRLAITVSIS